MTNEQILAALAMTTSDEHYKDSDGGDFTIYTWMYRCTKCNEFVSHEDTDENIFRVWDCSCRESDDNEKLIWAWNTAEDERRQAEFWETEQASLTQAEARWSEGWTA